MYTRLYVYVLLTRFPAFVYLIVLDIKLINIKLIKYILFYVIVTETSEKL